MGLCLAVGWMELRIRVRGWRWQAGTRLIDAGGSVQGFLEGITTVQRNAFGQGAKFGTDPLSTTISPRVRLFD